MWPLNHKNEFVFNPSPSSFVVEEIPLYPFNGEGEHLILKIRKKDLTTWELIEILSNFLGVKKKEIGYAGLKDKHALTYQYISLPKKYEEKLKNFSHPNIKIVEKTYHNNKIRVGHLKGNRFWMRFKKVLDKEKSKIESVLEWIKKYGMPNYFGVQRFGVDGKNYLEGKEIVEGKRDIRDKKTKEFLISSYQSYLFNSLLAKRVTLSNLLSSFSEREVEEILKLPKESLKDAKKQPHPFKILKGDILMHYPFGKIFFEEPKIASDRFVQKDIAPTGLIAGKRVKRAVEVARIIEEEFDKEIKEDGSRRYFFVFPEIISQKYIPQKAWYELEFILPKGSYATILVDFLKGQNERE
ncbi:MAG: tRNA pseudouridine(13) synthase TruD [Epsilonproteobacteria bacterium]|nr:tRNA pseudouridine(13) synthase TruD [Campylobacterota bacterium]